MIGKRITYNIYSENKYTGTSEGTVVDKVIELVHVEQHFPSGKGGVTKCMQYIPQTFYLVDNGGNGFDLVMPRCVKAYK